MYKKILCFTSLLVLAFGMLSAENSFYTQNGFGLKGSEISVRSMSLGNTGGAILDSLTLTSSNPAFWYDFETASLQGIFSYSSQESEKNSGGFEVSDFSSFSMKFPIGEFAGVAFGLKPDFRVNYETSNTEMLPFDGDTLEFLNDTEYKGGISEAYIGFGYKIGSRLSVGLKSILSFGNYDFYNFAQQKGDNNKSNYHEKLKMAGFGTEIGVGWREKDKYAIAMSYSINHRFNYRSIFNFYRGPDKSTSNKKLEMPSKFTLALQKKLMNQLYFTSDFYYLQGYSDLVEKVDFFSNVKSDKSYYLGLGLERVHGEKKMKQFWKNLDYRLGAYYRTEPFYRQKGQIKDICLSAGLGIPLNFNMTMIDIGFQYINRSGFLEDEIGKETIYKLNFGITTGGLWFGRY